MNPFERPRPDEPYEEEPLAPIPERAPSPFNPSEDESDRRNNNPERRKIEVKPKEPEKE